MQKPFFFKTRKVFLTGASGFIGTNLLFELLENGCDVRNYDLQKPACKNHEEYWQAGDLLDSESLLRSIADFQPDYVIHLGARTECIENITVEEGYEVNTVGTRNLIEAIKSVDCVEKAVITSSQYVCGPGRLPKDDDDYFPHTVYGQSKVETEKITRKADLKCTWFFIRPVNIWGPHHVRYSQEFWKVASKGFYFHPSLPAPIRTYGYIGNVVWQIMRLLELDHSEVHEKVFYVGDRPIKIDRWSLGFHQALRGKDAPRIPMFMMKLVALVGDGISKISGKPFLINSQRLKSMTQDYLAPMEPTFELLGEPPFSLDEGIQNTADWFRRTSEDC